MNKRDLNLICFLLILLIISSSVLACKITNNRYDKEVYVEVYEEFEEIKFEEAERKIEDKNVISRIMSAVPEAAKVVANSAVAAEGLQLAKSGVYMAKLPSGAQLVKSQEMQGAVRGFFKSGSTIKGQANFLSVDGTMEKIAQMNLANVAMGAASMVVGQY